jgi:hypothetical protein
MKISVPSFLLGVALTSFVYSIKEKKEQQKMTPGKAKQENAEGINKGVEQNDNTMKRAEPKISDIA